MSSFVFHKGCKVTVGSASAEVKTQLRATATDAQGTTVDGRAFWMSVDGAAAIQVVPPITVHVYEGNVDKISGVDTVIVHKGSVGTVEQAEHVSAPSIGAVMSAGHIGNVYK